MRSLAELDRRLSFILCGGVAASVYLGTQMALVEGLDRSPVEGAILAFLLGTMTSYVMNSRFTFRSEVDKRTFLKFLGVTLCGYGLSIGLTWAGEAFGLHYVLVSLIVMMTIPVFNFMLHSRFTYRA